MSNATATIYTYNRNLSWSSNSGITSITQNKSTTVTNSSDNTVWWWSGTGSQPGNPTQLASRGTHSFDQGSSNLSWSFSNTQSQGSAPQITLTVTGKGKDED